MSKRGIGKLVAPLGLLALLVAGLSFWGDGFGFGRGDGVGQGTGEFDREHKDRFVILVDGDKILVSGQAVDAEDAVRRAKEDGRPIRVFWKRAKTGAESALKSALKEASLAYDENSL